MLKVTLALVMTTAAFPTGVFAQTAPPSVTIPSTEVAHAINYLRNGGTRTEADALADQILKSAQTDVARQQEIAKKEPSPSEIK